MENVLTLGKVIGLLLFCPPSSLFIYFLNSKNTRYELARPVMGNIFLVYVYLLGERSEPHTEVHIKNNERSRQ